MGINRTALVYVSEYGVHYTGQGGSWYHFSKRYWIIGDLIIWLKNRTQIAPTNACFINGKCVQAGVYSPNEINELEDLWK